MDGEQEGAFKPRGIRSGRSAKRKREAHQRRQFILHPEHYSDPSQVPVVHQGGQQRPLYTLPTWEPHYTSDEEEVEVVQVISEPSSSSKAPALSGPATSPKLPPPKAVIPVAVAPVPAFHRLAKVPPVVNLPGDSAVVNPHTGVISHLDRTSASQIPKAFVLDFHNVLDRFFPGGVALGMELAFPTFRPLRNPKAETLFQADQAESKVERKGLEFLEASMTAEVRMAFVVVQALTGVHDMTDGDLRGASFDATRRYRTGAGWHAGDGGTLPGEVRRARSLTIRGIRLNSALPAGSEIRLLAPSGNGCYDGGPCCYSFRQPFDASQVLSGPALDLSRSRTEEQLMVLVFQGDLSGDDGALDLVATRLCGAESCRLEVLSMWPAQVVAEALAITAEGTGTTPWKLETRSVTGRVLGVQGDLGSFDQLAAFDFLVVTATTAAAGAVFDLAVFFAMPAHFDLPGGSLLRLRAPLGAAFATGATGLELPTAVRLGFWCGLARLASATRLKVLGVAKTEPYGSGQVRPMPPKTSCLASADARTLTITLDLDGLTQGATYAFQWPAQRVVGQEASWRPLTAAGATGHFADLLLADEVASAPRLGSWSLEALRAGKRLLKSEVFATGLEMKSLSPVWLLPMRPFYGQECLVFVVFSLGGFAFAPTARLRLKLQSGQAGATERLRFLSCERQEALLRQGAWAQPLAFGTEAFVASQTGGSLAGDSALATVAFENCVLGQGALQSNESSMRSFEELQSSWLSATGLEMTLDLQTQLDPASEQYLLVIALLNPPRSSGVAEDQMIIEVIDGSGEGERAAARSPDLRTYALASEMKLTHWSHSTSYTSAWNQLILEFQPVTVLSDRQAEAVGFLLLAPPTFVFTEKSCEDLVLQRTLMSEDLQTGELTSRPLFLEERPGCEVVSSEWLREGGYYQHQLTIFLPPLVGFRTDLRYRLEVAVRNPPLPLGADLLKRALRDKTSPKFSTSPFLVAALNVWRICTFVWAAGDTGKGDVPFAVGRGMAAFGRLGGISKVDEVAWKGFDVVVNT
ncbi:unnamed protein product [Symbiodinium natans]|uniref:Uncharacterized protein n=1 Tax=Symbiodinium natans TaxID=878477 RepID=A0A812RHD2_9DINO|nr:unnamed protein product [Symbiodinium natans]